MKFDCMVWFSFVLTMLLGSTGKLFANNIAVSNVITTGLNVTNDYTMVEFDLSWENSWRTTNGPANWDAAWVFVKFQVGSSDPVFTGVNSSGTTITVSSTANLRVGMRVLATGGIGAFPVNTVISSITNATQFVVSAAPSVQLVDASIICRRFWEHAELNTVAANHTAAAGSTIEVPSDATGVFVYRSTVGSGSVAFNNMQLRWDYGLNGVADDAVVQVQVFAIEMVYVPGGMDFNVGGGGGTYAFTTTTINTAVATTAPAGTGSRGGAAGGQPSGAAIPNADWPNGYNAFYCMKYEMSQGQYRDFLNTLDYVQQGNRTAASISSAAGTGALVTTNTQRNGIDVQVPGDASTYIPAIYGCNLNGNNIYNESDDGEWIACNHVTWMDGCAYLDWAGLRPMTELEFEKACRGDQFPVVGEYAWGTNTIHTATYGPLTNSGAANELPNSPSTSAGNAGYSTTANTIGPMRVGIFATATTTREQAGATYWGIMDMSGNLWERAVGWNHVYTGVHGDGQLNTFGHATESNWPGLGVNGVTVGNGSIFRGGSWGDVAADVGVSDRSLAAVSSTIFNARSSACGIRGVRSAP